MKLLVTGFKGRLGSELIRCLRTMEAEIGPIPEDYRGVDYEAIDYDSLDISDEEAVKTWFESHSYDIVINCAAITNVDGCEFDEEETYRVNAIGPRNIARVCARQGAKFVQVSMDYVFPGNEPGNRANLAFIPQERLTFVYGDICNAPVVDEPFNRADACVHFAAKPHNNNSVDKHAPFLRTNVEGAYVLIEDECPRRALPPHLDRRYAIDSTKLCCKLGWLPKRTIFAEGLEGAIAWYRDSRAGGAARKKPSRLSRPLSVSNGEKETAEWQSDTRLLQEILPSQIRLQRA